MVTIKNAMEGEMVTIKDAVEGEIRSRTRRGARWS